MSAAHNTLISDGRYFQSAPLSEILAPKYVNRGARTSLHPNRFCIAGETAILFCRSSSGHVFGVRIDKEDLVRVLRFGTWRVANFCKKSWRSIYAYTSYHQKIIYLHRFIVEAPAPSSGLEVDHRHRHTLDCRKSELRLVSKSLNQRNREKFNPNMFGVRGVSYNKNRTRFIARVFINHKAKRLGTFDTLEQAAGALKAFNEAQGVCA